MKELIYYTKGYNPTVTGNYGSDIILIILDTPATINKYVRPICLDWTGNIFDSIDKNTKGRVSYSHDDNIKSTAINIAICIT